MDWNDWKHVYPENDLIEHNFDFEKSPGCSCDPYIDEQNLLVIHDSLDRRELYEKDQIEHPPWVKRYSEVFGE